MFHCILSYNMIEEKCDQLINPPRFKLENYYLISPDIDECASSPSPCDQGCSNSVGSYTCSCVSGFRLGSNGKTCNGKRNLNHPTLLCIAEVTAYFFCERLGCSIH